MSTNTTMQAQGRPMLGKDQVNLRLRDEEGRIGRFCEELKRTHPNAKAEDLYAEIFLLGMAEYEAEKAFLQIGGADE